MSGRRVCLVGATSSIGRSLAHAFAKRGDRVFLGGRNLDEVDRIAKDLTIRYGQPVRHAEFEALRVDTHASFLEEAKRELEGLDGLVVIFGDTGNGHLVKHDPERARRIHDVNFTGAASILDLATVELESRKAGFLIGVGSVAGDRGRPHNYVYGAAKAALHHYLQGLRGRLYRSGVHVLTVKPGFVDTPMTYGKENIFLAATPDRVARAVIRALDRRRHVIYVPWFWRWIVFTLKCIPEWFFKRLDI